MKQKREIKFRGKEFSLDLDGKWVYGHFNLLDTPSIKGIPIIGESVVWSESLGQFVGITDKNGKEIYEDDIVKFYCMLTREYETTRVFWDERTCSFCGMNKGSLIAISAYQDIEVIGNIHDNPELLNFSKP